MLCVVVLILMTLVAEMPRFGDPTNPSQNYVSDRYVSAGPDESGGYNLVNNIIMDYRAFDTLGETTVLLTAILAATLALSANAKYGK